MTNTTKILLLVLLLVLTALTAFAIVTPESNFPANAAQENNPDLGKPMYCDDYGCFYINKK